MPDKHFKLPESLKVGAHTYKVLYPYQFKETELQGQADHLLLEIRVKSVDTCGNKVPETVSLRTLLHEMLHAVDRVYNDGVITDAPDGERSIECLAQGLTQVLLDNGLLKLEGI
jgi:hypothetical protein